MKLWTAIHYDSLSGGNDIEGRNTSWSVEEGWRTLGCKKSSDSLFLFPEGYIRIDKGFAMEEGFILEAAVFSTKNEKSDPYSMLRNCRRAIIPMEKNIDDDSDVLVLFCRGQTMLGRDFPWEIEESILNDPKVINFRIYRHTIWPCLEFAIVHLPNMETFQIDGMSGKRFINQNGVLMF